MAQSAVLKKLGRLGRETWTRLPKSIVETRPMRGVGHVVHRLACEYSDRSQSISTYFLRNKPLITTITEQIKDLHPDGTLRLCSVGCSTGAEIYSVVWMVRKSLSSLPLTPVAVDTSESVICQARMGSYKLSAPELRAQLPRETLLELFDVNGEELHIKPWIAEGIRWIVADARDPRLVSLLGQQDVVLANNFLIHMRVPEARMCMSNLLRLLRGGGLFVCRGVDLDVRESVARSCQLEPVLTRIEEIHNADAMLDAPRDWPWKYWGLEPLDKKRRDWALRYSAIFRAPYPA
jgi:SAM-dependent methyltransferase